MKQRKTGAPVGALLLLAVAATAAGSAQAADPRNGAKLYNMHCAGCHGVRGTARMAGVPDFSRGQALFKSDPDLLLTIENGRGVMPAFRGLMSTREILDVLAYLRTLR